MVAIRARRIRSISGSICAGIRAAANVLCAVIATSGLVREIDVNVAVMHDFNRSLATDSGSASRWFS